MTIDTISNMLSTIKNTAMAGKTVVEVPYSKQSEEVAKVLKSAGFVSATKIFKEQGVSFKKLRIDLETIGKLPKLSDVKRISKPGQRVYKKSDELKKVAGGYGVLVISTPRGIISGAEARKRRLGGEVICLVW